MQCRIRDLGLPCGSPTGMMARMPPDVFGLTDDPLWYKDAIIYELHVRTFYDSNGAASEISSA